MQGMQRLAVFLACGAMLGGGLELRAQSSRGGGTSGGTTGGTTSPGGGTNSRTTQPSLGTTRNEVPQLEMRRQMYVSGQVRLDDGMAPPEPVVIQLVCNGQPRPQGYTDSKGRFGVTLGQDQMVVPDASISNYEWAPTTMVTTRQQQSIEQKLMGCELRADLPGFRSDVVNLSGRRMMDRPEVGTILLHRIAGVEGYTFSMTTANAPKEAKKAYEKGVELRKKGKLDEAGVQLEKAVAEYPKFAVAWFELGETYRLRRRAADSEKAYLKSVESDGKFVSPHLELLQLATKTTDWELIAERSARVIQLNPVGYPMAWFCQAAANFNLKKLEEAERSAKQSVKLDEGRLNPRAVQLYALVLREKGDFAAALEQFREYAALVATTPESEGAQRRVAEMERLVEQRETARKQ